MRISESLNAKAKALFDEHMKGKNILTPDVLGYGVSSGFAYEFSAGTDFERKPMYGVTVLELDTGKHRHDLSKCFASKEAAAEHVEQLALAGLCNVEESEDE